MFYKKNQKKIQLYNIIYGILVCFLLGSFNLNGYSVQADSFQYILYIPGEGIMPIYPCFILINRCIFGVMYLYAVIWEQVILGAVSIYLFVNFIRKKFTINIVDMAIIYLFLLIPYLIDFPSSFTKMILTEGISYSFCYIYMVFFFTALLDKKWKYVFATYFMAIVLSLIRSQLEITIIVSMVLPLYICISNLRKKVTYPKTLKLIATVFACLLGIIVGILTVILINSGSKQLLFSKIHVEKYRQDVNEGNIFLDKQSSIKKQLLLEQEERLKQDSEETLSEEKKVSSDLQVSQYVTLIFARGMYESDFEDYALFDNEEMQKIYIQIFNSVDNGKARYSYMRNDLWAWKDIQYGIVSMGKFASEGEKVYYETASESQVEKLEGIHIRKEIGLTLIKAHFVRVLKDFLIMLPQSLICTAFFQIESYYLLCHIITVAIYLFAIAIIIWGYKYKQINLNYAEFTLGIIIFNCIMAMVISIIFCGMQRYLVYGFGVLYSACYLSIRRMIQQFLGEKNDSKQD